MLPYMPAALHLSDYRISSARPYAEPLPPCVPPTRRRPDPSYCNAGR